MTGPRLMARAELGHWFGHPVSRRPALAPGFSPISAGSERGATARQGSRVAIATSPATAPSGLAGTWQSGWSPFRPPPAKPRRNNRERRPARAADLLFAECG